MESVRHAARSPRVPLLMTAAARRFHTLGKLNFVFRALKISLMVLISLNSVLLGVPKLFAGLHRAVRSYR